MMVKCPTQVLSLSLWINKSSKDKNSVKWKRKSLGVYSYLELWLLARLIFVFVERGNSFRDENYISGFKDLRLHFSDRAYLGLEFKYGANPVLGVERVVGKGRGLVASAGKNDQNFLAFATK